MKTTILIALALLLTSCATHPIERLQAKLSADSMWINGETPVFPDLKESTDPETVALRFLYAFGYGDFDNPKEVRKGTKNKILDVQRIRIQGVSPDIFTAVLLDTNLGKKIVLVQFTESLGGNWWGRVFDAGETD